MLSANFVADFSSFMAATKEAVSAMQGFETTAAGIGPAADAGMQATEKQLLEVAKGVRQLSQDAVAAAQPFVQAFSDEQEAVGRLTTALETTGQATPAVIAAYAAMATQFQTTTKYADEAVIAAQATLTTIGRVGPEQMQLALTATTNLASALQIDLNTAALLVAKSLAAGNEPLGKLKTLLGEAYQPGMNAAQMLELITERTGPAAQKELKTYAGQMANLNNAVDDVNESVGKVLVDALSTVMGWFQKLPGPVQTFVVAVVAIGTALAPVLVSIASLVAIVGATGLGAALGAGLVAIAPFVAAIVGIGAAAVATYKIVSSNWELIVTSTQRLYEGVKLWLVDKFNALVAMIKAPIDAIVSGFQAMYQRVVGGSIVPDMINGIGRHFGRLDAEMVQPAREASDNVIDSWMRLMQYTNRANAILRENTLYTTPNQLARIAALPGAGGGGGGRGGGGTTTIQNTFNLVDSESNLAHKVADIIMRQIRAGTQLT